MDSKMAERLARKDVDNWNKKHPVGQWVDLRMDDGTVRRTRTYAKASLMCNIAVGWFIGICGCYMLSRATPVEDCEADFQESLQA
jgi:hypothetical protein